IVKCLPEPLGCQRILAYEQWTESLHHSRIEPRWSEALTPAHRAVFAYDLDNTRRACIRAVERPGKGRFQLCFEHMCSDVINFHQLLHNAGTGIEPKLSCAHFGRYRPNGKTCFS